MPQPSAVRPPVNLALFGVGRWGTHLLRNFLAHPQVELRAVVEASPKRLAAIESDLSSSHLDSSTVLTGDWQAAMNLAGLDACVVATPAKTHYKLIEAALNKGLHVLAEKPLTLDVESSQRLCDLARQQRRQLVIDHTYLFHSAVSEGKKAIAHLGPLRYGYATRTHLGPVRRDVDALWDLAIHDISIFNHWLGESPVRVQCQGNSWLQPNVQTPLSPKGLADMVWCRLQYPSGFQATIHLCWANPDKQRRLCVVGDRAALIFDEMNQTQPLVEQHGSFAEQDGWFTPQQIETVRLELPASEPLGNVCEHFIQCVEKGERSLISSGEIGTELVTVLVALSKSLERDGQWTDCTNK